MSLSIQNSSHRWWALGAIAFGLFMALLDVTIVNVALPSIQRGLHESYTSLEWVVNAYVLVVAVLLVTSSRLGDIFGRKRMFTVGMGVFTLGSLLCALSPHIHIGSLSGADVLNISRAIEGAGGSAMLPLSLSLITATFHGRERGTAFGIWGGVAGLATAIGPLVGGILVTKVGWPSIFYLNVPTGIIGMVLGMWAIHESKDVHHPGSIDFYGLITLTISLFCLILALMKGNDKGWGSAYIVTLFVVGGLSFIAFAVGELRIRHPMLDPRIFKIPSFTGSAIAAFTVSAGVYALLYYLSIYMQNYLGFSALGTGLRFLPMSGLVLLGAPIAGRFTDKVGAKWILGLGMAFMTAGTLLLTRLGHATIGIDWTMLLPGFILIGIANGLVNPPISALAMGTVEPRQIGMASGTSNVARQTGTAFGIAALGALWANRYAHHTRLSLLALPMPHLPSTARTAIINGVKAAGPIAGSVGLKTAGPRYTRLSIFPRIAALARHAFLFATRDVVWLAAVFVAIGLAATLTLVRPQDMLHHQQPAAQPSVSVRNQALLLTLAAAWMARGGATADASAEERARLERALNLLHLAINQGERQSRLPEQMRS
jgi:EmrB/QacA subfamily drug resistance transporter